MQVDGDKQPRLGEGCLKARDEGACEQCAQVVLQEADDPVDQLSWKAASVFVSIIPPSEESHTGSRPSCHLVRFCVIL